MVIAPVVVTVVVSASTFVIGMILVGHGGDAEVGSRISGHYEDVAGVIGSRGGLAVRNERRTAVGSFEKRYAMRLSGRIHRDVMPTLDALRASSPDVGHELVYGTSLASGYTALDLYLYPSRRALEGHNIHSDMLARRIGVALVAVGTAFILWWSLARLVLWMVSREDEFVMEGLKNRVRRGKL